MPKSKSFLDDYEPVEDRLARFWEDHPDGRVITELVHMADGVFIVKAHIHKDGAIVDATGYAREEVNSSLVNRTSALENCETSAIGRALANLGYAAKGKRPSREEMRKTETPDLTKATWRLMEMLSQIVKSKDYARQLWAEAASNFGLASGDIPESMDVANQIYDQAMLAFNEATTMKAERFEAADDPQAPFELEDAT